MNPLLVVLSLIRYTKERVNLGPDARAAADIPQDAKTCSFVYPRATLPDLDPEGLLHQKGDHGAAGVAALLLCGGFVYWTHTVGSLVRGYTNAMGRRGVDPRYRV